VFNITTLSPDARPRRSRTAVSAALLIALVQALACVCSAALCLGSPGARAPGCIWSEQTTAIAMGKKRRGGGNDELVDNAGSTAPPQPCDEIERVDVRLKVQANMHANVLACICVQKAFALEGRWCCSKLMTTLHHAECSG